MYACKQCGTGNSLDSSFCKKCGAVLPTDELKEARTALAALLEEGNTLFTEGRTDEAILIAEMAVQADPSSHVALSLKGLCHDRLGQLAEALECYEAAVAMNPDSTLDKIKVAALRNRLAQHVTAAPESNRRAATVMATAAVVLVLVVGAFTAMASSGHKDPAALASNTTPAGTASSLLPTTTATTVAPPQAVGTQPQTTGPGVDLPPVTHPTGGTAIGVDDQDRNLPPVGPTLPLVTGEMPPLRVEAVPSGTKKAGDGGIDPPPTPIDEHPGTPTANESAAPPESKGVIDIEFGKKPTTITGGSQTVDSGLGAQAARRAADTAYQLHNYGEAANHYRQVADLGGDTAHVQQRLGECYTNLGQTGAARAAYNRAISKYEAQIKSGQGVDRAQQGLDSCEQALKVLGG